jgi:two-component system sensor histidine kinase LytS
VELLTLTLFERLGLLLVVAFMLTRIPGFRSLLDRELDVKTTLLHAMIFGLFGIAAAQAGVLMDRESFIPHFWVFSLEESQMLVGSSLVAIVIAGLLGGPFVGLGAGVMAGVYLFSLGGMGSLANLLVNPLTGLLAGLTARFFSEERIIAPSKALFIGIFPPILKMGLLLIFTEEPEVMVSLVNLIGPPLVISNSVAIAVFTAMIRLAWHEKEQEAALETRRALAIAEKALPYLENESPVERARGIAELLYKELNVGAVSVTDREAVLAHIGLGADHHRQGDPLMTRLAQEAIRGGRIFVAHSRDEIRCRYPNCPLQAAIIVPIFQSGEVIGLIKLYYGKIHQLRAVEVALAQGLGKLISNQLSAVAAEKMRLLIRDAELRNLQAQINPHFLFNTLHLIATLIRVDPDMARHITVQLGHYMRLNLRLASASLIRLEQECEHLNAYLEIIRARFAERLTITCQIAEGVGQALLPPSSIQPLVENCITHGLRNVADGGRVEIVIARDSGWIQITVRDNGCGFPKTVLEKAGRIPLSSTKGGGIGLYNVNQRLIGLLGESSRLHIRNLPSGGSEVFFRIPHREMNHGEGIR